MHLLALLGIFTDQNDRFLYPFIILQLQLCSKIPTLSLKPKKGTPFGRTLPV